MAINPIATWLTESPHSSFTDLNTLVIMENASPSDDVTSHLSQQLVEHRIPLQVVEDMTNVLGWKRVKSRLTPNLLQIRNGDFGEMLACQALEVFGALEIPVKKIRFQINPNQTLPGADIVGLEFQDERIVALHFVEAKFRTTGDTAAGNLAHTQLESWHRDEFDQIIMFIASRLFESRSDLYAKFIDYLTSESSRADEFHIVLIWENEEWTDTVLLNIPGSSDDIDPLTVRTILIKDLAELTSETYLRVEELNR
jgi:hypothetical protein